eukprot:1654822-Rhodomonas_salina.1
MYMSAVKYAPHRSAASATTTYGISNLRNQRTRQTLSPCSCSGRCGDAYASALRSTQQRHRRRNKRVGLRGEQLGFRG